MAIKRGGNISRRLAIRLSVIAGIILLGVLTYRYIAPFGKIVSYRFTSKLPGAEEVTTFSQDKDSVLRIPAQIIKTSQSKLSLKLLSKDIESIRGALKFKKGPREIRLGVRGGEKDNFSYRPLYNSLVQNVSWEKIEEGGFVLWQREKKYQTLYDFVNNPSKERKTAFYWVDQSKLQILKPTETKKEKRAIIETPLRGNHVLLVKVDVSPLVLKVSKQDMNVYNGEDRIKIVVLKDGKTLAEKYINDDGITDANRLKTVPQEETITLEGFDSGLYQVNILYESEGFDSLITKIEANQPKIIFKNNISILGNEPTTFWTNIKTMSISANHEEGLQTAKLNEKYPLEIKSVGKQYNFNLPVIVGKEETGTTYKILSPKNDLNFQGDGYFAFSEDAFFESDILKFVDLNSLNDLKEVDYVLTGLPKAKIDGDWLVAETNFNPKDIKIEGDKLYFSLEAPELGKYGGELEIDYLEIAVKSKGILEKPEDEKQKSEPPEVKEEKKIPFLETAIRAVKEFPVNIFNKVKLFFVSSYQKIFRRLPTKTEETVSPTPTIIPTSTPTPTLTPTPTPTGTPAKEEKLDILVRVLNGGARIGAAGDFAQVLKNAGFTNVAATNADNTDYKNATLRFRAENKREAEKIIDLLKKDYETINKNEISTTSAEIIIILGSK